MRDPTLIRLSSDYHPTIIRLSSDVQLYLLRFALLSGCFGFLEGFICFPLIAFLIVEAHKSRHHAYYTQALTSSSAQYLHAARAGHMSRKALVLGVEYDTCVQGGTMMGTSREHARHEQDRLSGQADGA